MEITQVVKFRRTVLRRIAEYTWNDCLAEHVYDILKETVSEETPRVRCCVHKERAVLKNRIQMAMWQPLGRNIINAANAALAGEFDKSLPVMDVLPDACDACPIDKYYVTDVCRHCISHKCMNNCPKNAISIINNRAFINRQLCIECGRCAKSCPYGAILEINRPCIRSCALEAMSAGEDKRTVIDYEKCVSCGNCRSACPFGALDERSMIVPLLLALKAGKPVVALLAPSFVGQFGVKVSPAQLMTGLKKLGFLDTVEVAVGADITTIHEAEEFAEKVPEKISFMTSSCCPAFVELVKKHFPEYEKNISKTTSPMVSCGIYVKDKYQNAVKTSHSNNGSGEGDQVLTCFIGPCIAKKAETIRHPESIDFAITYEELQCIFEGVHIDLTEPADEEFATRSTTGGIGFPLFRGVQASVKGVLEAENMPPVPMDYADGLENCQDKLQLVNDGKLDIRYFEGMACSNGCVDGPGSLSLQGLTRVLVTKFGQNAPQRISTENPDAVDAVKRLDFEVKES